VGKEHIFVIEQVLLEYDPEELIRWRQGDPTIVPVEVLNCRGPGRVHGYGYAEHIVEKLLVNNGFEAIKDHYNLFPVKKSVYEHNNVIIAKALGKENYDRLQKALGIIRTNDIRIELPDICVVRPDVNGK